MENFVSDVAFTPSVKAVQEKRGSRDFYAGRDFRDHIAKRSTTGRSSAN